MYFPQITIFGLGAVGGALARLVKRRLPDTKVIGVDNEEVIAAALQDKVIDKSSTELKQALSRSSLIILAASPTQNLQLLTDIAPLLSKRKLVMDVTSAKSKIIQLADRLDLKGADFIGGHPLFGSERSGYAASQGMRIEGSTFCVVPGSKSSEIAVRRLIRWLVNLNLRVEVSGPLEHDAILARTSHLIQLVAVILGAQFCKCLNDDDLYRLGRLSGPSLRQLARLMKSPAGMWQEIIELNKEDVISALTELQSGVDDLIDSLQSEGVDLERLFEEARRLPKALEAIT
jgi:prephenate dehydrogenase